MIKSRNRQAKDAIYGQLASLTKALSNPKRLEIIDLLCQGEKTVEAVSEQAALGLKNASAQLKELRSARLVEFRREGKHVFYRIADPTIAQFWTRFRTFGHSQLNEIQQITRRAMGGTEALEEMDRKALYAKAKRGDVVLLDVRPTDEFESGHLPFAISVPISQLSKHLKQLSKKKEIVAYCRGPYCFFAKEAVETLRKQGFKAYNLSDSVVDWAENGMPIARAGKP
jgi:rhodanese-related sulfurtransferase